MNEEIETFSIINHKYISRILLRGNPDSLPSECENKGKNTCKELYLNKNLQNSQEILNNYNFSVNDWINQCNE